MSDSASASVYVGARLSVKEVMNLFGEKREKTLLSTCPKDKTPRSGNAKFCSTCGQSYKTSRVVKEGIKDIRELDSYHPLRAANLETCLIEDHETPVGVIIGKEIASGSSDGSDEVIPINADISDVVKTVKSSLTRVGITTSPSPYLVTTYCY